MGEFPSGQRGQTVNLLRNRFDGSNPSSPTKTENHPNGWFFVLAECGSKQITIRFVEAGAPPRQAGHSARVASNADFSQLLGAVEKSRAQGIRPLPPSVVVYLDAVHQKKSCISKASFGIIST